MKPAVDAMGELLAVYGADVTCRACDGVGIHADSCPWLTIAAWHKDANAILDGIRQKVGLAADLKPVDSAVPAEIRERGA